MYAIWWWESKLWTAVRIRTWPREEVRQKKKKQKIRINSSKAKSYKRKECEKGSVRESEKECNYRVSLHADDYRKLIANNAWQNTSGFEKFKTKMNSNEKPRTVLTYSWKNVIKRFGKNKWMLRAAAKTSKCKNSTWQLSKEHLPFVKSHII